jgi:hypothetical protein
MDYAALARELGGTLAPAPKAQPQKFNVLTDSGRNVEVDVRFPTAEESTTAAPQPVDMQALAAELGGTISAPSQPETTVKGLADAATRGLALPAAGAALGAAIGAPFAGVGAIPGAVAGAGAATLAGLVADPIVGSINSMFGTTYTLPTDALQDLLTRVGVAEPRTAAERIVQTTAAGAGTAGGMAAAGKGIATAADAALDVGRIMASRQGLPFVAGEALPAVSGVGKMLATAPGLQVASGASAGGAGQIAKESGAGPLGQIAATLGGAMLPAAPQMVRAATQATARAIAPRGAGITQQETSASGIPLPRVEPTFKESVQSIKATVGEKIAPENQRIIKSQLAQTPDSVDLVNVRLSGTQVVPDNEAASAIKQGWKDGTVASIKAATDKDRSAMTKMLNVFKMGEKSDKFRAMNRPADILGDTVQSRVDFLANANQQAGKAIDRIANTRLRGQAVEYDPAINSFLDELGALGVKVELDQNGVAKAVLQGSDIQGDKAAQRILNTVLERLSTAKAPDAYGVHTAKRFIDTQVNYGKKNLANPLTSQAERALKNLRRNLNQSLGEKFPVYKAANEKYADTITALDDLQRAAGTQIDFDSPNANKALGTAMRKLTSNYGTRANLIDSLDQANQVASKYGMKLDDDIVNQLIFVNELDRMFGAVADTSLKGQMSQALETGVDIARGGAARRAVELLAEKAEGLRGINKENAIKAMEEILKRKANP